MQYTNLHMRRTFVATLLLLAMHSYGFCKPVLAGETLSYGDLARRMYDLQALAEPPVPGEMSGAATSADRASQYDAAKDVYVDWHANADGSGFV